MKLKESRGPRRCIFSKILKISGAHSVLFLEEVERMPRASGVVFLEEFEKSCGSFLFYY